MALRTKEPLCEIIFGQMHIPISDKEKGKRVIEGIFMIGETGRAEAKPRGRGRRRAKRAKAMVRVKRAKRAKRMKRVTRPKAKRMKKAEIAKKPPVAPMTVG